MIVWIALAGGLGAITRFMLDGFIKTRVSARVPWATLCINITGSFLLGAITAAVAGSSGRYTLLGLVLGTGFMGGYTTFSTASFETVRLVEQRRYIAACTYALGGVAAALLAAFLGYAAMILIFR